MKLNIANIIKIILFILFPVVFSCKSSETKYTKERQKMVEEQIKARGILNKEVINAMTEVKRHLFVPENLINKAYGDYQLSIGFDQTISQPYIVAYMTEILGLKKDDKVLEIGTGLGYQAAILSRLCSEVYTIEIVNELSVRAQKIIKSQGYNNIYFKVGDGYMGWQEHAPFNAIIVTCAPENIPPALEEQLAEGGRMIIPVGRSYVQKLVLIKKVNGKMKEQTVLTVRFFPMVDENGNSY